MLNKILLYTSLVLLLALIGISIALHYTCKDRDRLASNQVALMSDMRAYKTKAGNNAASIKKLTLTKSELQINCNELTKQIQDMGIKLKRVQSISSTSTHSDYEIHTQIKDSIVYRDHIKYITLHTMIYSDPWIDLNGVIDSLNFKGSIQTRDTLIQVVHKIPKKFLFFRFGCKAISQDIMCTNPHSKITFTKYIEVK